MSELPPLPDPVMTETNPHFRSGHDPYNGAQFLNWHTPDQMQAYARAAVAAEREACAQLLNATAEDYRKQAPKQDSYRAGRFAAYAMALDDAAEAIRARATMETPASSA